MARHLSPLDKLHLAQRGIPRAAVARVDGPVNGNLAHYQAGVKAWLGAIAAESTLEARVPIKRRAIADVWPFVAQYLNSGAHYPNSVAVQACIWLFDVGDIDRGLSLGLALQTQGCHRMPARFERPLQDFLVDEVYNWANAEWKAGRTAEPFLGDLIQAMDREKWDLHPLMRSKSYAMAAKHAALRNDWQAVKDWCEKAAAINPVGHGTKTLHERALIKLGAGAVAATA